MQPVFEMVCLMLRSPRNRTRRRHEMRTSGL